MLTREIQLDTHGGPVTLNPRWLRIPAAVKYSGLSRSRLYEWLSEGKIRSICVKSQKWAQRGVRLIDRESIDWFRGSSGDGVKLPGHSIDSLATSTFANVSLHVFDRFACETVHLNWGNNLHAIRFRLVLEQLDDALVFRKKLSLLWLSKEQR